MKVRHRGRTLTRIKGTFVEISRSEKAVYQYEIDTAS